MNNRILYFFCLVFLVGLVSAASTLSTPSVCCQKTTAGAFCLNTQESSCDSSFSISPTSCESTSYCKLGTCYNSKEGICMENVPQTICKESNGTWSEKSQNELPQCNLGCCILADQAAFVTLARCKSLSTFYGIKNDFRASVSSETACIELANSQDEGACVTDEGDIKTCMFTTREQCKGSDSVLSITSSELESGGTRFYKDILCSAEELGTVNARQTTTGCYKGKVYWYDSEGQRENVYSSDTDTSWNKGRVADADEICSRVGASKTCGNCDYLLGGVCAKWDGLLGLGKPKYGEYLCKTTTCKDREGNERKNGESWCVYDSDDVGNGGDPAGSRHYREICVDGKIKVEACEDFRNQICIHSGLSSSGGEFSVAACRVNRWQDCTSQTKKDQCENTDQRDCLWVAAVDGVNFTSSTSSSSNSSFTNPTATSSSSNSDYLSAGSQVVNTVGSFAGATAAVISPLTGYAINYRVGAGVGPWEQNSLNNKLRTNRTSNDIGLCVPAVSPGFEFWESSGTASGICAQASASCTITYTKHQEYSSVLLGAFGDKDTTYSIADEDKNKTCLKIKDKKKGTFEVNPEWAAKVNAVCSALGDCGADYNINGVFTDDGYQWTYRNDSYYFTQADLGIISGTQLGRGTGEVILAYVINDKYKLNQDDYVYVKE